jgi:hypothetical protein
VFFLRAPVCKETTKDNWKEKQKQTQEGTRRIPGGTRIWSLLGASAGLRFETNKKIKNSSRKQQKISLNKSRNKPGSK